MRAYRGISRTPSSPADTPGLYDPRFDHDGCGVAFVATLTGVPTHAIVASALQALVRLGHRGGRGADPDSGDGAGILVQLPDAHLRRVAPFPLPPEGAYGVGMVFLPRAPTVRRRAQEIIEQACEDEGTRLLGWRDVPIRTAHCGAAARAALPRIRQFFVAAVGLDGNPLERRLYVLRRVIERRAAAAGLDRTRLHIASLSSRTLVYKGMLTAEQLGGFYPELRARDMTSKLAMVHARFSTNVLPRWDLAQPLRSCAHNGEINTLRGNAAWMRARESKFRSPLFGGDIDKLRPVLDDQGSDSAQFDNALELLAAGGRSIEHAVMMMIPEAWHATPLMDEKRRAFYEFHASLLEPWDGPAALAFTDGRLIGATLDRNGLRPARWLQTDDGLVVMASEAGVLDIPEERIVRKWRLEPGRLLLVDTVAGAIVDDAECKRRLSRRHPYASWIRSGTVHLDELADPAPAAAPDLEEIRARQRSAGWTEEELRLLVAPMAAYAQEPTGSMGNDAPPAVLSSRPLSLFNCFKQLFAQVTNPPIDPIREATVMSLVTTLGAGGNLLEQGPSQARRLEMPHPVLSNADLDKLRHVTQDAFPTQTLDAVFDAASGAAGLEAALLRLCNEAARAVESRITVLVLSDRAAHGRRAAIPSLLATSAVHHHLVAQSTRTGVGLVVETAEIREVAQLAQLIGYGAEAVNPWLLLDSVHDLEARGLLPAGMDAGTAQRRIITALHKGLLKVIAKMGISTVQSYCGAQMFEALGLDPDFVERWFPGTPARVGGAGMQRVAEGVLQRHALLSAPANAELPGGGDYQWRRDGERHRWSPEVVGTLQHAVRSGDIDHFRRYVALADDEATRPRTLRGLFRLRHLQAPVPIDEVEPAEALMRRFVSGAMSLGSLSPEMHETLAVAMNRIGGRSNTGEGGEDPARNTPDGNGDSRRSAIKQVASGRFGVTTEYLVNADEIQIKIAQGAKPGEGGQLPGGKVDVTIARLRHSTPGVGLISPPPHHDIYCIEDLGQLIHDLRCVNPKARISVKLVSEAGVGTVAAGVAKAGADHIVISGCEGGTGASPLSSIKHAGVPWELGLAEAQQVLMAQGLRGRVTLQTDGQMQTGRDVVIAALLGADEFGFATAPLVAAGCVMMRVCHLNTCPVGIATQDPRLRARFTGRAEQIVTFMRFLAEDVREWMSRLGFRSLDELIGRADVLTADTEIDHPAARSLDLQRLLAHGDPAFPGAEQRNHAGDAEHAITSPLDGWILDATTAARHHGRDLRLRVRIENTDRSVGARLSGELVRRHGAEALPDNSYDITLHGSAGQSLGAFLVRGVTLRLEGEANDHVGKGLSGGRIVIRPAEESRLVAEQNVIAGNVCLYGATSGELFIRGVAGERFAVRNSGAVAVVEGIGDHGCEYMTGGVVVVLGRTGHNFAAGMSGGLAYVLDADGRFTQRCNLQMVALENLDAEDDELLSDLLTRHHRLTGSPVAEELLRSWGTARSSIVKVVPDDYRQALVGRRVLEMVS